MTYDTSGNYATAKTNQAGNTVYYSYDVNGNVTSAEDGEENQTSYTYNKDNSMASVSSEEVRNEYSYDEKGSIVTITHNGFNYDLVMMIMEICYQQMLEMQLLLITLI